MDVEKKRWNIHLGGRGLGVLFPDFHQPHLPEGRKDFCPYLALIGSIVASVHDKNFLYARLILL